MIRHGHSLTLYCYHPPQGVPEGIQLADARDVIPEDRIIRYRSGSYALFSNRFRYELQRQGRGTWVDCDAYLLQPLDGARPYLIGEETPGTLNGGILRTPRDSPLLTLLLRPFERDSVPSWIPLRAKIAARLRHLRSGRFDLTAMPWGTTGPLALTALAKKTGVDLSPLPPEILYPVPWQEADWIIDPSRPINEKITSHTVSIHLWNERIKHLKERTAAPGSFLARLQEEGA